MRANSSDPLTPAHNMSPNHLMIQSTPIENLEELDNLNIGDDYLGVPETFI